RVPDETVNRWEVLDESVRGSLEVARAVYPPLATRSVARSWAGIEAFMPDDLPVLGPVPGVDGLLVAAGFSGPGFARVPAAGGAHPRWPGAARRRRFVEEERARDAADPRPASRDDPAGPDEQPEPGLLHRDADPRAALELPRNLREGARDPRDRAARVRRDLVARGAASRLPAPALGGHAPAGRRRHGHLGAAAAFDRGRAHDEPRSDDPGPVSSSAQ